MENFPSNSQRARQQREEPPAIAASSRPKVQKVIEGEVIHRKKSFGKKVKEMFFNHDGQTVGEYLREDIFLPAIRDLVYDIVVGGAQRSLFPDGAAPRRGTNNRFGPATGRVNYGAFSQQPVGGAPRTDPRQPPMSPRGRATHDFSEILIPSRPEAEMVLEQLFAFLDQYQSVTVADLLESVGISSNFTDRAWGWTDLRGSSVSRARNGYYMLNLPPTVQLEA